MPMAMPTELLLFIYFALMFSLALIVRQAYVRRWDTSHPKHADLAREIGPPYIPRREGRQRTFDWTTEQ
jgi:hypothetical protein